MTVLLNYLPYLIGLAGIVWMIRGYRKGDSKKTTTGKALISLGLFFLTMSLLTNYGPRIGPSKPPVENFVVVPESDGGPTIQDRVRKPEKTVEESKKSTAELVDWRAAKAAREKKYEQPVE